MCSPDHEHDSKHPRHSVPVEVTLVLKEQQPDVPESRDHHSPQWRTEEIQQVEHQQREPVTSPPLAHFQSARGAMSLFNLRLMRVSTLRQGTLRLPCLEKLRKTRGA